MLRSGARGELGQRRLAAGFGDGFQQVQSAIDRLDVVAVALGMRSLWTSFGARSGQNGCFHCCFSLPLREIASRGPSQETFRIKKPIFTE